MLPSTATKSAPTRRWEVHPPAPFDAWAAPPGVHPIVASILWHRGVRTPDEIRAFLEPEYEAHLHDPFAFRDMTRAVDRLFRARESQERILIHGDYDADGVSGAAILSETLDALGCVTDVFIPHREREGYGFTEHGLRYAIAERCRVIVTCDCGIASAASIASANATGIDCIVTDHHLIPMDTHGRPMPPPAYAILHPKVDGETYPFSGLTGGGVAFKLCQALLARDAASEAPRLASGFEKWLLDCVAISTVADFGRLVGENRALVSYGLIVLEKTRRLGLRMLYEVAGIRPDRITPATIGFQIAPRINAAGRIDHANEAFRLLRTGDPAEARALAEHLQATNTERQRLVAEATEEAFTQVGSVGDQRFLVVVGDGWAPGIVGLVATRLRDAFERPTIVLTRFDGKIMGSGRSIPQLNIVEALRSVSDLLDSFGGHSQACGLTVKGDADLPLLVERLEAYASERLSADACTPTLTIDAELDLADATFALVEAMDQLEPFGIANPTPRFLARGCEVVTVRTMGSEGQHCRIAVRSHVSSLTSRISTVVCFRYRDICPNVRPGDVVDLVYEVGVNEWNGRRAIQLKVVDARPAFM